MHSTTNTAVISLVVGQHVIAEPTTRRNYSNTYPFMDGKITSVGRKFFYVQIPNYSYQLKVGIEDNLVRTDYGIEFRIYPDLNTFRKEKERLCMANAICDCFSSLSFRDNLSWEDADAIFQVLTERGLASPLKQIKLERK